MRALFERLYGSPIKERDVTAIAIIDYDAGNTFNVQKALQHIGTLMRC